MPTTIVLATFALLTPSAGAWDQCFSKTGFISAPAPLSPEQAVVDHTYYHWYCGPMYGQAVYTARPLGCQDDCIWAYEVYSH